MGDESLANDIAMHAAATDPMAISPSDIPEEIVAMKEKSSKPNLKNRQTC